MLKGALFPGLIMVWPLLAQPPAIRLARVASGINLPTTIQHAGDGTNRLFVVEQAGLIRILQNGVLLPAPFLDINDRVTRLSGIVDERGLLGLAFPPDYRSKQYFYVNYTNLSGHTVIARYGVSSDPDRADPDSERILLTIEQPFTNHNGGQLAFGPDGFLYIGTGDGGGARDPRNLAQDRQSISGSGTRGGTSAKR